MFVVDFDYWVGEVAGEGKCGSVQERVFNIQLASILLHRGLRESTVMQTDVVFKDIQNSLSTSLFICIWWPNQHFNLHWWRLHSHLLPLIDFSPLFFSHRIESLKLMLNSLVCRCCACKIYVMINVVFTDYFWLFRIRTLIKAVWVARRYFKVTRFFFFWNIVFQYGQGNDMSSRVKPLAQGAYPYIS